MREWLLKPVLFVLTLAALMVGGVCWYLHDTKASAQAMAAQGHASYNQQLQQAMKDVNH